MLIKTDTLFFFFGSIICFAFGNEYFVENYNRLFNNFVIYIWYRLIFVFFEGIAVYKNPTSSFKRKYRKYFLEDETDFLFKNFEIPLYKTWFRNRIKELEDEVDKEGFSGQMKNEALFHRVKFFLENEVPEELKKENKRKMRLQEEKRMKNQKIEAKFKKYIARIKEQKIIFY